jgi:CDP-diacylglycerol--serine O-phosphatidyltransferase
MNARRPRRGIYLLPTLFTVGNLFCGFSSLIQSSRGQFEQAAVLIIVAGILDLLDGRIARLTGADSEFGVQFDSLSDLVSFGVAPAFLAWAWALAPLHRLGWLVVFLFVASAATRLARFNTQVHPGSRRFFAGLPTPPAAAAVACAAFAFPHPPSSPWTTASIATGVVLLAVLMISRIRYRSFKDIDLRHRRSYVLVVPLAAVLAAIAYKPAAAAMVLAGAYVASGPVAWIWTAIRRAGGQVDSTSGEVADEPAGR